jgi:hypothetical protein
MENPSPTYHQGAASRRASRYEDLLLDIEARKLRILLFELPENMCTQHDGFAVIVPGLAFLCDCSFAFVPDLKAARRLRLLQYRRQLT